MGSTPPVPIVPHVIHLSLCHDLKLGAERDLKPSKQFEIVSNSPVLTPWGRCTQPTSISPELQLVPGVAPPQVLLLALCGVVDRERGDMVDVAEAEAARLSACFDRSPETGVEDGSCS